MVDCNAFCVKLKASNIPHDGVGCGVLSGRLFAAGEIARYYYQILIYSNLTTQKHFQKTYDDEVMYVAIYNFTKRLFKFPQTFLERTEKKRSA